MRNDAATELHDADSPVAGGRDELDGVPLELLKTGRSLEELLATFEPLPAPAQTLIGDGEAVWLSAKNPGKAGPNEDACIAIPMRAGAGLLLVADGLGGHRGGREASQKLRASLAKAARRLSAPPASPPIVISQVVPVPVAPRGQKGSELDSRSIILEEIERVNQRLLRSRLGAATTLVLVELQGRRARTYHVGDSEVLIVSQRGRVKYSTVSHSPVGYALESGLLSEDEAIRHPDRHLVSNVVGSPQMSVELGPWIDLAPRDTVLMGSDGLFDNLTQQEIREAIRKGPLEGCVQTLARRARDRMLLPQGDLPSKPDDLTILAYRPLRSQESRQRSSGTGRATR